MADMKKQALDLAVRFETLPSYTAAELRETGSLVDHITNEWTPSVRVMLVNEKHCELLVAALLAYHAR